jgi:hypothetical protein
MGLRGGGGDLHIKCSYCPFFWHLEGKNNLCDSSSRTIQSVRNERYSQRQRKWQNKFFLRHPIFAQVASDTFHLRRRQMQRRRRLRLRRRRRCLRCRRRCRRCRLGRRRRLRCRLRWRRRRKNRISPSPSKCPYQLLFLRMLLFLGCLVSSSSLKKNFLSTRIVS